MPKLAATTVPISQVTSPQRAAMWTVFEAVYSHVSWERFNIDLDCKDHVILLWDGERICGFSTMAVDRLTLDGREVVSVFSGDTVIDASYRGQTALQWAFFRYIVATKLRNPRKLVVWFLISKGYKTYLLLSRNFTTFYPRRDKDTPVWANRLIRELAHARFGDALDPNRLLLRFGDQADRLRASAAPIGGQNDPDILFFERQNPRHAQGEELCCIGVINRELIWAYPSKLLRGAWRRAVSSSGRGRSRNRP